MAKVLALDPLFETVSAKTKRFREVVVFVHHYGGNKFSFSRHIEWLNDLGFDCVTFNLPIRSFAELYKPPVSKDWRFGVRHIWADRIEAALGHLPQEKFIFSFSFPSVAALMAIHRRRAIDIKGWVCDGGPFKDVPHGVENLLRDTDSIELAMPFLKLKPLKDLFLRRPKLRMRFAELSSFAWGLSGYDREVDKMLSELPTGFPVLSIRCDHDKLVTPDMIEKFFANKKSRADVQVLNLKHAAHLMGFREEPELYKEWVHGFLVSKATPLS